MECRSTAVRNRVNLPPSEHHLSDTHNTSVHLQTYRQTETDARALHLISHWPPVQHIFSILVSPAVILYNATPGSRSNPLLLIFITVPLRLLYVNDVRS